MVSITPITVVTTPTTQKYSAPKKLTFTGTSDRFTPSADHKSADKSSWYLRDEHIIEQNDFTTTVERVKIGKGFLGLKKKIKIPVELYDLPIRLAEDIKQNGDSLIKMNEPKDILQETGLTNDEFLREIEKINAIIMLTHPRYDLYPDETYHEFEMQLGKSSARIKRITQGLSGVVYRITVPNCKSLALKHYLNPLDINLSEGAFPEIALAKKFNEDNVQDIPRLFAANPYNGWMLNEFIGRGYKMREDGISLAEYCEKNNLHCSDINSGMSVHCYDGEIFVDFGYIAPHRSSKELCNEFQKRTLQDRCEYYNKYAYLNNKNKSTLEKTINTALFGSEDTQAKFYKKHKKSPEFKFYQRVVRATDYVEVIDLPKDIKEDLQSLYEQIGGIGSAAKLIESCKQ